MRKRIWLSILAALLILAGFAVRRAYAQVSTTLTAGVNMTMNVSANEYVAVPACSTAAKCVASLEICNEAAGKPVSTSCILIGTNFYGPALWLGINQTTTASGGTSSVPYQIGTVQLSVPPAEVNQAP